MSWCLIGQIDRFSSCARVLGWRAFKRAIDCSANGVAQNTALDANTSTGRVEHAGESRVATITPSKQLIRAVAAICRNTRRYSSRCIKAMQATPSSNAPGAGKRTNSRKYRIAL